VSGISVSFAFFNVQPLLSRRKLKYLAGIVSLVDNEDEEQETKIKNVNAEKQYKIILFITTP
jgi:hypothetical protein